MSITFSLVGQTSPAHVRRHEYVCQCVTHTMTGLHSELFWLTSEAEQVAYLREKGTSMECHSCNSTGVCQWNENLDDVNFANINAHLVLDACGFSGEELHYGEYNAKDFEVKARRGLMRLDIINTPVRDRLSKLIELAAKRDNDSVVISWG